MSTSKTRAGKLRYYNVMYYGDAQNPRLHAGQHGTLEEADFAARKLRPEVRTWIEGFEKDPVSGDVSRVY